MQADASRAIRRLLMLIIRCMICISNGSAPRRMERSLRGIKDSPPYFHDGRLLTLEDAVEFFNLAGSLKLDQEEKKALTAFLRAL